MILKNILQKLQEWVRRLWHQKRDHITTKETSTLADSSRGVGSATDKADDGTDHPGSLGDQNDPAPETTTGQTPGYPEEILEEMNFSNDNETSDKSQSIATAPTPEFSTDSELPESDLPGENSRPPRNVSGRRRRQVTRPQHVSLRSPVFRPELICRKPSGSWKWEMALSIDGEHQVKEVRHDGTLLDVENGELHLASFSGRISIIPEAGEKEEILLFENKPLIFKLGSNWEGNGRKVRGITNGYFIVIAPVSWEREGHESVEPEGCTDTKFRAHFFHRDKRVPQPIGGFRGHAVELEKTKIEFTGQRVFDDSDVGDLFVGDVPTLKPLQKIIWVRVGEEQENGWGENFKLSEQTLAKVLNGRQGRFFIRIYDSNGMLDSEEFRYLHDLKEILIDGSPYTNQTILVPPPTGYPSFTKVEFIGSERGNVIVGPNQTEDVVSYQVETDSGNVDIIVNLPRVWWRFEQDGHNVDEWQNVAIDMTRQEFRERASSGDKIRLQLPKRVTSVHIGFNDMPDRKYSRKMEDDYLLIQFDHFVDYSQIDRRLEKDALFNIQCGDNTLALIRITADPVTDVPIGPFPDGESIVDRQLAEKIMVFVQRADGKWKNGKGFSHSELEKAGCPIVKATSLLLPVDKRRRSMHPVNVSKIKELTDV